MATGTPCGQKFPFKNKKFNSITIYAKLQRIHNSHPVCTQLRNNKLQERGAICVLKERVVGAVGHH